MGRDATRTVSNELRRGENIDHVATVRNARGGAYPDPLRAAKVAEAAGADGITAHLREDRRHIADAESPARPPDTTGNFAAIGNQDGVKYAYLRCIFLGKTDLGQRNRPGHGIL